MNYRIIGAILVIISTSTVGFSIAASHRKEASALMQLIRALEFMSCELEYRLPPLPELCRLTSMQITGPMKQVFAQLEQELQRQTSADAYCCMSAVLKKADKLPEASKRNLLLLGKNLGRFDVTGQLSGIASVIQLCRRDLDGLLSNQEVRLRSYRTLGICAGVALVILFI
jgi:stage III sporulation protein AB